jgi:hypothetical protein
MHGHLQLSEPGFDLEINRSSITLMLNSEGPYIRMKSKATHCGTELTKNLTLCHDVLLPTYAHPTHEDVIGRKTNFQTAAEIIVLNS